MKLFGKEILKRKQAPKELYDFAQHGLLRERNFIGVSDLNLMAISGNDEISREYTAQVAENNAKANAGKSLTPKEVYLLESLNDEGFTLNCHFDYITKQADSLRRKAKLLPKEKQRDSRFTPVVFGDSGGVANGRLEVESMIERMENRYRYAEFKDFYDEFPYTTSARINDVLAEVTNLRAKRLEEFIPDLPDEALDVIERYNDNTLRLCEKKPVYYMIADKKDFGEMDRKRDPILLAQSPFCLGWQVLGAWDEEMVYLGDL